MLAAAAVLAACAPARPADRRLAAPNDNRRAAGRLRDGVLTVRLDVVRAEWRPEADSGPGVMTEAFAEPGQAPRIPGPLLRVPTGTTIDAVVRNTLPDSAVTLYGFLTRPAAAPDSIIVRPGDSVHVRFAAGAPGTYFYAGQVGRQSDAVERETLSGAFVVDSAGGAAPDRIFVMNIWGAMADSATWRNALAINGKAYPYSETLGAQVGDTVRWRWVNATVRPHPMHLHGFYYQVTGAGDGWTDTAYAPDHTRRVVTEQMQPFTTMNLSWVPERAGNWLFHCHIGFHVVPVAARLTAPDAGDAMRTHESQSHDPRLHMAGLALGITVRAPRGWREPARENPLALRLFVNEGRKRARSPRAMSYVLAEGGRDPARDSVTGMGSLLVLERGRPTDVTVINRLREPTAVHWHGIELESRSDGVAGWSGTPGQLAPVIAPGDSFLARLSTPRAGTFIYHTHLDDLVQLTSGLVGPLVVLEPGQTFDPATDHVLLASWDGEEDPPHLLINGDSVLQPMELAASAVHRFRLINIGVAVTAVFTLERAGAPVTWRWVAKDGADLPPAQAVTRPAVARVKVGETYDFLWTPPARGTYRLRVVAGDPARGMTGTVTVR